MTIITKNISLAIQALQQNEVIGLPTETVYGLAGNIFSEVALQKIFAVKKRPSSNPLIIHIHSLQQLMVIAKNIPATAFTLAEKFWPGALTFILEKKENISSTISGGANTIAVRIPNHTIALELLQNIDFPLAAPSANPFTSVSPTSPQHVFNYFKNKIPIILDGGICEKGLESTIIGFKNNLPVLYRHGAVAVEDIEKVVGKIEVHTDNNIKPAAPGMFLKHYSPKKKLIVTDKIELAITENNKARVGLLTFHQSVSLKNIEHHIILSKNKNLEEAAQNLYSALHDLDEKDIDIIIAEKFPDKHLGRTINDRLKRAAYFL